MDKQQKSPIAVIGSGSWGTALAFQLARCGNETRLWGRDSAAMQKMVAQRCNQRYLPEQIFPQQLQAEPHLPAAVAGCEDILVSVPSHAFRETLEQLKPLIGPNTRIAWATKGLERHSGTFLHKVVYEVLGVNREIALLSGPTFAMELAKDMPGALTIASPDPSFAQIMQERIHSGNFRAYIGRDILGAQLGGAVKNVLAVAAGICDGLGFGTNTRSAMITRGLNEMRRLGNALGAQPETFMGLTGLGDLILTCSDNQSRNRRFGLALAAGKTVDQAVEEIQQVVEGYYTADEVWRVSQRSGVEMPICEQVYEVLYKGKTPQEAVLALEARKPTTENG